MGNNIVVTGMVLQVMPIGEYDKRITLLTKERGKITAFARGARRPNSQLLAAANPFCFGEFELFEGRSAYTLARATIQNYFRELTRDFDATYYGFYFLEFADYYSRENLEATEQLLLLYQSLRALLKPALPNSLVQAVFELRSMAINGDYTEHPPRPVSDSANYAWEYIVASPLESLYTFTLAPEVLEELKHCVELNKRRFIDREFHSLEILKMMETAVRGTQQSAVQGK